VAQSVNPADAGISIGQVFQGKYRVEAILGHGGMGVVAECTHLALNERVAIKMLRQDVLLDQDAVSRFIREAQAAVKLKSEYVARVSDVGTFENGVPYMVMEYLEGHDLGELLKERGVLPVQWAVELMLQTAEALAEAHSLAIVHRDIKPTNLFVTWRPDGSALIKVLDFGISKSPMGTDMQLTQTQSLLGTPAYMSPEQMRSARLVDARTDIWSLGTVFYEILEGRRPFEADSFSEMCVKVAVDPPSPMVNTPPGLQQVVLRCLAKSPEQRFASMADFARELVPYSPDPHGAQMLVERMQRMLRRAAYDWEGNSSTGASRNAVPGSVKDLGSGPIRPTPVPHWGLGSDPAGRAWHGHTPLPGDASQPFARPFSDASQPFARPLPGDASQPFARPLGDDGSAAYAAATVATKKRRLPLILLGLAALAAGAITIGVVSGMSDKPTSKAEQVPASDVQPGDTHVVVPVAADSKDAKDDPVKVGESGDRTDSDGKAGDPKAGDGKAADTKAADTKAADARTGENKAGKTSPHIKTGGGKSNHGGKAGGKSTAGGKTDAKGTSGTTTTTQVEDKPPEPAKKKCDPFDAMHGCSK
jgi:eukaryotic-like serine/threonine-protein kinase